MSFWTFEQFRAAMGGRWLQRPVVSGTAECLKSVTTDSREAGPGVVFFARKGEQTDGHNFLKQASQSGSPLLVVDDEDAGSQLGPLPSAVMCVDDSTAALGRLAAAYRQTLRAKVIAVTGSAGKTTTKTLIHSVLSTKYRGTANRKSYNNHVGVPLTILSADPMDQYLVVEVGTNAPGEIAALGRIVCPDIAVITHIGPVHLEGLGGIEGVLREKASLLSHIRPGGLAVVNGDFPGLLQYRKVVGSMLSFGRDEACDLRLMKVRSGVEGVDFEVNGRQKFHIPLLGEHNAMNALAAIAVARHMNLSDAQIAQGLAHTSAPEMRLNVERLGPDDAPVTLLNDCYNANPDSMTAALKVLRQYPTAGRRIALLADMGELGRQGPELHRALGETVAESRIDQAWLIGKLSMFTAETVSRHWASDRVRYYASWDDSLGHELAELLEGGDTVLVKGSRFMGLERMVAAIRRRWVESVKGAQ